jgi:hypothetical protein
MAQAVIRRPLTAEDRDRARVGKVEVGQVFLRIIRFSPVDIISPWLSILIITGGKKNRPVGGRTADIVSPHRHERDEQGNRMPK